LTYVLISLRGDEATVMADEFAQWFATQHEPAAHFHTARPDPAKVRAAIATTPRAIVFGHNGGGSIRSESRGGVWLEPDDFGEVFADATVWVYACSTREQSLEADLTSFGRRSHANGVRTFLGHCGPTPTIPPFASLPYAREKIHAALARGFRAFTQGTTNARELERVVMGGLGDGRDRAFTAPILSGMSRLRTLERT
jgi:hypothetical protein